MIREIEVSFPHTLDEYAEDALLAGQVRQLREEARLLAPRLAGRTVWMVNSAAQGGGVAEMLPKLIHLMRELGVETRWCTINPTDPRFFTLTKRLHNAIHGVPVGDFTATDKQLFDDVSKKEHQDFVKRLGSNDVVVIHDPQPAGLGALLQTSPATKSVKTVWRCHIGLDHDTDSTRHAWSFLKDALATYDHAVFSAPAYIAPFLGKRASIIQPAIDPLSHKNRWLHPVKLMGVLGSAGLAHTTHPSFIPRFETPVARLNPDGEFVALDGAQETGLLYRPIVTQISRWDRLKGWFPLMLAFRQLKSNAERIASGNERNFARLRTLRLVMAGPDPASIADDPEAESVLAEVRREYMTLPFELQQDIAVLSLPMDSQKNNALIVNALQRSSSVVVQNSLREGFGLSVTEAMWKHTPVLGSCAYGIQQQIKAGIDGELIDDPTNPGTIVEALSKLLASPKDREHLARNAHQRAVREFLLFRQLTDWLRLLARL